MKVTYIKMFTIQHRDSVFHKNNDYSQSAPATNKNERSSPSLNRNIFFTMRQVSFEKKAANTFIYFQSNSDN